MKKRNYTGMDFPFYNCRFLLWHWLLSKGWLGFRNKEGAQLFCKGHFWLWPEEAWMERPNKTVLVEYYYPGPFQHAILPSWITGNKQGPMEMGLLACSHYIVIPAGFIITAIYLYKTKLWESKISDFSLDIFSRVWGNQILTELSLIQCSISK